MRNLRRLPLILTITCFLTRSLFSQNPELVERAAAGLKNTIIATSLEQKLKAGQNVVYCATIQLAWNELIETFTKEPIQIAGDPAIVHDLNQQLIRKQDFSEDCYMTMADFGKNDVLNCTNLQNLATREFSTKTFQTC